MEGGGGGSGGFTQKQASSSHPDAGAHLFPPLRTSVFFPGPERCGERGRERKKV